MKRKILIGLGVLLMIAVFLSTRDWDAPELGRKILAKAGEATGATITASGFRFNLFRGVILENVEASSAREGREMSATLDRLVLEHRVGPLLSGTVAINQVVLEQPKIEIVEWDVPGESPPPEESSKSPASEGTQTGSGMDEGGLALDVKEVRLEDGVFVLRRRDAEGLTRVEGLDLRIRNFSYQPGPGFLASLAAEGDLGIGKVMLNHFELREIASVFRLARARFEMPELSLTTDYGDFATDAEIDFNPTPYAYRFSARGPSIDVNRCVGASSGFGPASVELDIAGEGPDPKAVVADGVASLSAGTFPDASVFRQIDEALGKDVVVGSPYKATQASFRLENGVVSLAPFQFEAERLLMAVQGTASLDGPIDFDLSVATDREGIQIDGVGGNVLDVLSDDNGWVPIPIHISGTTEDPRVRPDGGALVAQAGSGLKREAKEAATDAAKRAIRGLIPKQEQ
ncbi:MAG TPA: hypothetical protein VEK15_31950 [Vicinamibacteria bacterium]|nr:hypothetical protein [Vicinamibacteria bacterium]